MQFSFSKKHTVLSQPEDFAHFFEEAHLSVFRYVMVLCAGDQAWAEDVTAEAFLRAWEKRDQFQGSPAAALGWVITIARNLLIDQQRSAAAHPLQMLNDDEASASPGGVEELLVDAERVEDVLAAFQALPFAQRNLMTLRYVLNWPVKEIAAHLGLAENTVSVDLRRARAKVQAQLTVQELAFRKER
jgi:RNA polymerase sigma-70 factor (ECF subfamily)